MVAAFSFYIDDSGTRNPDRDGTVKSGDVPWFGLGGLLVRDADKDALKASIATFRSRWPQMGNAPLHSHEIRHAKNAFHFLKLDQAVKNAFLTDLTAVLTSAPILAHACVIDRAGYMERYHALYGERRWELCKTGFAVAIERAVKFVRTKDPAAKLRVYVEKSGAAEDARMRAYYGELRAVGMPFQTEASKKYTPLAAADLRSTLYEFKLKDKSSSLMQLADLYLFPICRAGYRDDFAVPVQGVG